MRLLYVTDGIPNRDPLRGDGSALISYEVIKRLPPDVDITLLTFSGAVPLPAEIGARCRRVVTLSPRDRRLAALRSLVLRSGIGTQERATRAARQAVAALSADADVTLVHGPHASSLAAYASGPTIVQVVDPWSLMLQMEADLARPGLSRYLRRKSRQALALERRLPPRARLLTVGRRDADLWSSLLHRPVGTVPNGIDPVVARSQDHAGPTACFVGSLNYAPNVESAHTLVRTVAPRIWESVPEAQFLIAGRLPTSSVLALAGPRVSVMANVPAVSDVFAQSDVAVFPDAHGVGARNSVAEALAAGLPVVATESAARNQPVHPRLTVVADLDTLVDRTVVALSRPSGPQVDPGGDIPSVRTWDEVAADYYAEISAAAGAS